MFAQPRSSRAGGEARAVDGARGDPGLGLAKAALAVLHRNQWVTVEQTVAELPIRLGERARALSRNLMAPLMDNVTTARNVANNGDTV